MKKDWSKLEVGALWKRQSKSGTTFYSGNLKINGETIKIVGFANKEKKDKQPDVFLYIEEEKEND